jgi:hypothetical protein
MAKDKQITEAIRVGKHTFSQWISGRRFSQPSGRKILVGICIVRMQKALENENCQVTEQEIVHLFELASNVPQNSQPKDREQKRKWYEKAKKLLDLYQLPARHRLPDPHDSKGKRELRDLEIKFLELWEKLGFTAT